MAHPAVYLLKPELWLGFSLTSGVLEHEARDRGKRRGLALAESIHVLLLVVDCHIPQAQSLKQKRSAVKSLIDRLRGRLNASVAETGYLNNWQRAAIAVSLVSNDKRYLQQQIELVQQLVLASSGHITVAGIEQHWL